MLRSPPSPNASDCHPASYKVTSGKAGTVYHPLAAQHAASGRPAPGPVGLGRQHRCGSKLTRALGRQLSDHESFPRPGTVSEGEGRGSNETRVVADRLLDELPTNHRIRLRTVAVIPALELILGEWESAPTRVSGGDVLLQMWGRRVGGHPPPRPRMRDGGLRDR